MNISIAMCTYNGGAYLKEQLESIKAQTRLPDELVICDDVSSDDTVEIAERFADGCPFSVRLYVNDKNLGSTKNFEKAIGLCDGDIIALSDQDDFWLAGKLERIENMLLSAPQTGLVFTDAEIVDERLLPMGHSLFQTVELTEKRQELIRQGRAFEVLLVKNIVTGATMAFRSRFRNLILPIPTAFPLIHDGWIALVIAAVADLSFINQPLIKYRQHPHQQMGIEPEVLFKTLINARKTDPSAYVNQAEQFGQAYERLLANEELCRARTLMLLKAKIKHLQARASLPAHRLNRIPIVLKEILNWHYARYSRGLYSAAKDILF
jgi:glycosyltransferase involved in cell wall biosynthesis